MVPREPFLLVDVIVLCYFVIQSEKKERRGTKERHFIRDSRN